MAKRRREPTSDGTTLAEAEATYKTVFIDTSLDTHLAMLVSYCEAVSDFKEKIMLEHLQCFPKFGKLKIQTLKVKRRGNFYHLPDFMLVRSAFEGLKRDWFLSADVSSSEKCNDNKISFSADDTGNLLSIKYAQGDGQSILPNDPPKMLPAICESRSQMVPTADPIIPSQNCKRVSEDEIHVHNGVDGHCRDIYSDAKRVSAHKMSLSDHNAEENVVSQMTSGLKVDDKTGDIQRNNSAEQSLRTGSPPKKKHKRRHDADGSHGPAFELDRIGVLACVKNNASDSEISGSGKSLVGIPESEDAQHSLLEAAAALSGIQIGQCQNEVGDVFDKRSQPQSAAVTKYKGGIHESTESDLDSGNRKENNLLDSVTYLRENSMVDKQEIFENHHLDSGNRKDDYLLETVSPAPENSMVDKEEIFGSNVANVQLEPDASRPSLCKEKRKKKRRENNTDKFIYCSVPDSGTAVNHEETDQTGMDEKQREVSLNYDPEVMQSKRLGPENQVEAGANVAESVQPDKLSDVSGKRKPDSGRKRMSKKSSTNIYDETDVKHSNNITSLTCSDVPNLELSNTKDDSILIPCESDPTTEIEDRNLLVSHEPVKVQCEADTIKEPNLSAKLLDANDAIAKANPSGIKRKKKRAKKAVVKIQDASDMEHGIEKIESTENNTGSLRHKEQEGGLSINHDPEAMLPLNSNSIGCDKPDMKLKETVSTEKVLDPKSVVEPRSSRGSRKKKSVNKSSLSNLEALGMDHTSKDLNGASSTERRESISLNKGKDGIERKSLEASAGCAFEEVDNGNEENLLPLLQTGGIRQSTEGMDDKMTKMEGKNLSPADSCFGDLPIEGPESQVKGSLQGQVYENQENTGHVYKKDKKKIKKKQVFALKDHANSPTKYQEVGAKDLTASEDELRTAGNPSEAAKLKDMPETDPSTYDQGKNFENENEGIDFKRSFIPGQYQDKVASIDSVKSTRSNENMNAEKSRKKHGLPSATTALSIQNPVKSSGKQENENQSFDSPSKHDHNEVMLFSKESLKVSENKEKASNLSANMVTRTHLKLDETSAAYAPLASRDSAACLEESNKSLSGSRFKRSKAFTEKGKDKGQQSGLATGVNSSKNSRMVVDSSLQKKSLLTKSGMLFWDNVSESSGDENGTVNSDASTRTPSNSSSSGYSVGENELGQESARNGPKGAKRRGDGGKDILKSDFLDGKNITMDMLLRRSASYKKAKHVATQREIEDAESQPVEFVPDSQVNP